MSNINIKSVNCKCYNCSSLIFKEDILNITLFNAYTYSVEMACPKCYRKQHFNMTMNQYLKFYKNSHKKQNKKMVNHQEILDFFRNTNYDVLYVDTDSFFIQKRKNDLK
jgi:DNA-directed RNA polymerase subunit M/transcription elongation factor TFIIS